MSPLAHRLLDALPQTQCTRCGYPDCAAYAQAMAAGEAGIDQCPPGGDEGVRRLAAISGREAVPLNPEFGAEGPRMLAVIDEAWCIGCTLCLDACPTDAIVGVNKHMHTVIEPHCTGCELCIPVCPVDCIALEPATPGRTGWNAWSQEQAASSRRRYEIHSTRRRLGGRDASISSEGDADTNASATERKRSVVEAALARARQAAAARAGKP